MAMATTGTTYIKAKTMVDLTCKVYAAEGWVKGANESWIALVKTAYEITMDAKTNRFIATRRQD